MAPVHHCQPLSGHGDDAEAITRLFREGGPGTTVLLHQRATYVLRSAIDLVHPDTTLATMGYPDFSTGDQAILETRGDKEATAVNMFNKRNTSLKRVHLRGCRGWGRTKPESDEEIERLKKEGKLGWIEGGGSLVWMGGPDSSDSIVEGCRIEDPRGWTGVHLCDFAIRNRLVDNIVGPCGQEAGGGPWADGLSIAGRDSLITGNTVIDATDGAIVIFCAPGTLVANNTIIARTRDVLGAINLVDDFPFERDFTGTRVIGNKISSEEGAYVRLAIGCGPTCWSPWTEGHTLNYGAEVIHNFIGPGVMGYGIAMSGVTNFTVQGNTIMPDTTFSGDLSRCLHNAAPTAFLREWPDRQRVNDCHAQEDFVVGEASWLIGCDPGLGHRVVYEGGQLVLDGNGDNRAHGAGQVALKGARWSIDTNTGELVLREVHDQDKYGRKGRGRDGKVLWSSGTTPSAAVFGHGHGIDDPVLDFPHSGALAVRAQGGQGSSLWDPVSYLLPHLGHWSSLPPLKPTAPHPRNWEGHPALVLSTKSPYLELRTKEGHVVFMTSYEYFAKDNWSLYDGNWIAIAPKAVRGSSVVASDTCPAPAPPAVPPRPGQQRHGLSSFVRNAASNFDPNHPTGFLRDAFGSNTANTGPPSIPPRPVDTSAPLKPTFLFLNPVTAQITLHSSPSPAHPEPQHTHWIEPREPVAGPIEKVWLAMQGDSNLVLYVQRPGGQVFVPWASATGEGDGRGPLTLVLKGVDEQDGPAVEMRGLNGKLWWSSQRGKLE